MNNTQQQLKEKLEKLRKEISGRDYTFINGGDSWFSIESKSKNRKININIRQGYLESIDMKASNNYTTFPDKITFEELKLCCLIIDYFTGVEELSKIELDKITELELEINQLRGENSILKEQNKKKKEEIKKEILKNVKKALKEHNE